jgi:glycyl-tRNA synthetase beta chain
VVESALLDEVTALVEWPVAVCGSFDEPFLELPREVLVASMQDHQKYFPVERPDGRLENKFITIANIDSRDIEVVRHGNERVIRPRLSDAAFFWEQDQKVPLADRLQNLDGIVFEQSLGTVLDKSRRVETLAGAVAEAFGADRGLAERAALLSRCDLLTEMVREFPELQGTMGGYYAARSGEPEDVVTATTQFYWPRFAGDTIPTTPVARAVACADKLDTLVGIFGIGAIPTGDKDPYGLRRAALGCLRIIIEGQAELDLEEALAVAVTGYGDKLPAASVAAAVLDFIAERLRHYYPDKGYDADVIDAVLAVGATRPLDIDRRIAAVAMFRALPEAADLSAANKRIANILRKAREDAANAVDTALFESDAEYRLESESARIESEARSSIDAGEYGPYLSRLAGIKDAVNLFFDDVMVMCDDEARRKNRLALLARVQKMFLKVADISRLAG